MTEYGNGGGYTVTMDGPFGGGGGVSSSEKIISIHAPVSDWKGAASPYSQVVEVYGLNIGSKVDIQISTQLLEQLSQQRIWFTAENRGGVVTLFAVGDKPAIDCEFQATLSDVVNITGENIEAIRGNTVSTVIPQGDFAQKDPNKSDFIKNKPAPFVVSNEKPEGAAIWFNKKENLDDTTGDAHIMAHDLNMGQHKLYGVPAPTANDHAVNMGYVNEQVKKAAPRNLLDNSDFRNPVNQAGVNGFHGTQKYAVDRWMLDSDLTATQTAEGLQLVSGKNDWWAGITQRIEATKFRKNTTYTVAVHGYFANDFRLYVWDSNSVELGVSYLAANPEWKTHICTLRIPDAIAFNYVTLSISPDTVNTGKPALIEWAAIYEGEYTLDTLPEYQPKGYAVELGECQRYFEKVDCFGTFSQPNSAGDTVSFGVSYAEKRVSPSYVVEYWWVPGWAGSDTVGELTITNTSVWSALFNSANIEFANKVVNIRLVVSADL